MKKFAIITGASRGIGQAAARYFVTHDYDVALIARDIEKLTQVKIELNTLNERAKIKTIALDIVDADKTYQVITQLINEVRSIDVLFNNAGIVEKGTTDMTIPTFVAIQSVNVNGMFAVAKAAAEKMRTQGHGYIMNVASIAGKKSRVNLGAYTASKHAVVGFNGSLCKELMPQGVKVTAICPGMIDTEMTSGSKIPNAEKIQLSDVENIIDFLLKLTPGAIVESINIECKPYLEQFERY